MEEQHEQLSGESDEVYVQRKTNEIVEAIGCLYSISSNVSQHQRTLADAWLSSWQKKAAGSTLHLWPILCGLLYYRSQDQQPLCEVVYFATTCLRTRIMRDWQQIESSMSSPRKSPSQPDSCHQLFQFLMNAAMYYSNLASMQTTSSAYKSIVNQLLLSIAALILHTAPLLWKDPISDLFSLMRSSDGKSQHQQMINLAALHIIKLLPEELIHSCSQFLSMKKRSSISSYLISNAKVILETVRNIVSDNSYLYLKCLSLHCLLSWLTLSIPVKVIVESQLIATLTNLIKLSTNDPSQRDLVIPAAEAMGDILSLRIVNEELDKLGKDLVSLSPLWHTALLENRDEEAKAICSIFVRYGEHNVSFLLSRFFEIGFHYMNIMLEAIIFSHSRLPEIQNVVSPATRQLLSIQQGPTPKSLFPSWSITLSSLSFWNELGISFAEFMDNGSNEEDIDIEGEEVTTLPDMDKDKLSVIIYDYFRLAVEYLYLRMSDSDSFGELSDDKNDVITEGGDLLQCCCTSIGVHKFLMLVSAKLNQVVAAPEAPAEKIRASLWAICWMLKSVSEEVKFDEQNISEITQSILSTIMTISPTIEPSLVEVIGLYSGCYSFGAEPKLLVSPLQYIVSILRNAGGFTPLVFDLTALAFNDLAKNSAEKLVVFGEEIVTTFGAILSGPVSLTARAHIINGLAQMIEKLDDQQQPKFISWLLSHFVSSITSFSTPPQKLLTITDDLNNELDIIGDVLLIWTGEDETQPRRDKSTEITAFITALWPSFAQIQSHLANDETVVTSLYRIIRTSLAYATDLELISNILKTGASVYHTNHMPCIIHIARVIAVNNNLKHAPIQAKALQIIAEFLNSIVTTTLTFPDIMYHLELVDDLMKAITTVWEHNPRCLFVLRDLITNGLLRWILQNFLQMNNRNAVRRSLKFITTILDEKRPDVVGFANYIITIIAEALTFMIFFCIAGGGSGSATSRNFVTTEVANVLCALINKYPAEISPLIQKIITDPSLGQTLFQRTTTEQRFSFTNNIMEKKSKQQKFQQEVHNFVALCRGLGDFASRTSPF